MVANVGWLKDRRYDLYQRECAAHIGLSTPPALMAR
jgi:hypothetical protein